MLHPLFLAALAYNAALHDPVPPPGYVLLTDKDGALLTDKDGAFLVERR